MSRATAWIEATGIPAVGFACTGFTAPAKLVARAEGLPNMRLVEYPPPNLGAQRRDEIFATTRALIDPVIEALTRSTHTASSNSRPGTIGGAGPRVIVARGSLAKINDQFIENVWCDGLPVVPPTIASVEAMLACTARAPDEVLGVLPPQRLPATVWKVAVNGVMAGCRPEYMPVLLAITEAVADPRFGLEHAGSTAGMTPLIILNGPIAKALGFRSNQGVLRPEARANITVSRFLRLLMVNVAGYRLGETDMATFGRNYYPVIAEAEDESPWPPLCADRGFAAGSNVVTVQSADTTGHSFLTEGPAESHLQVIAREMRRELGGSLLVPMEHFGGRIAPVLGLTPLVAGILAQAGFTKRTVKEWLYEHAQIPAWQFDEQLARVERGYNLQVAVSRGSLDRRFAVSDDPARLVPVLHDSDELQIVVCGASNRNRSFIAGQFGYMGRDVSKAIEWP